MSQRSRATRCVLAGLAAGYALPLLAHHSFSAEYDRDKPITLTGTVTKLEWTNPHARIYIDVKDETGALVNWDFELGPPNGLMRQGWNRNSLRAGQVVTINGFLSKEEPHVANARSVFLPDGRQVFAGSSFDTAEPPAPADAASEPRTAPPPAPSGGRTP